MAALTVPASFYGEMSINRDVLSTCVDACFACTTACEQCIAGCEQESDDEFFADCIRLCRQCAEITFDTGCVASGLTDKNTRAVFEQLEICLDACNACTKECQRHVLYQSKCKACAEACERCAELCAAVMTMLHN